MPRAYTVPNDLRNVVSISAGGTHTLALCANGSVRAWGENEFNQCTIPADLGDVVAVAAGGWHSLALRSNGTVAAWGKNLHSQCNVPQGITNATAIAAGGNHSLAILGDGTVLTWGQNAHAECDPPADLRNAVAISAGGCFSMALLHADSEPADALIQQLGHSSFTARQDAEAQLTRMGRLVLSAITNAQASDDPEVSTRAKRIQRNILKQ